MNTRLSPAHCASRQAFTLIELLVVITIIAILASLGFVAIQSALLQAKKAKARNDLAQIVGGVTAFYTEYGRYPISTTAQAGGDKACIYGNDAATITNNNNLIFNVLTYASWDEDSKAMNPRQIKFLEIPPAKDPNNPISGTTTVESAGAAKRGAWFDPWGFQYVVFIDGDYASDIAWGGGAAPAGPYTQIGADTTGVANISVGAACIGLYGTKPPTGTAVTPGEGKVPRHAFDRPTDMVSWQ